VLLDLLELPVAAAANRIGLAVKLVTDQPACGAKYAKAGPVIDPQDASWCISVEHIHDAVVFIDFNTFWLGAEDACRRRR
jgi:hypothetical protein